MSYPIPDHEEERIKALERYRINDSVPQQEFDDLTELAAFICNTPIALMSLVGGDEQWSKSAVGIEGGHTARNIAFCSHAIAMDEMLIVPDATLDDRFSNNPLVTKDPKIRFYAGAQLVTHDGHTIGTLCVVDTEPRTLSKEQIHALGALSRQIVAQLELHHTTHHLEQAAQHLASATTEQARLISELENAAQRIKTLEEFIPICSSCKKIHDHDGTWSEIEAYISDHSTTQFSHGICPDCAKKLYPDLCDDIEATD